MSTKSMYTNLSLSSYLLQVSWNCEVYEAGIWHLKSNVTI